MELETKELMTQWYFFPGVYIFLSLVYLLVGLRVKNKLIKVILKCAPVTFLVSLSVSFLTSNRFGPLDPNPSLEHIIWALIFSLLGDFYLVFDSLFLLGVGSFTIAQTIYIYLFEGPVLLAHSFGQTEIITAIAIALVSAVLYLYFLPKLTRLFAIVLLVYCVLISTMLWSAVVRSQQNPNTSTMSAAVGACLFYTSDLILALKKWRLKIPYGDVLVMSTYFSAQMFIARSVYIVS